MFRVSTRSAVLVAALLFLAVVSPALAAPIPPQLDLAADLKYLPGNTNLFFVIRMDHLLASDSFKKLRKEIPMMEKDFDQGFRKEFGFEISNVELMVFGGHPQEGEPTGVVHLKTAIKAETVVNARKEPRYPGDKGTTFKEEKVGTLTLYVPDQEHRPALCMVNDKTMLVGRSKDLKEVLERNKPVDLSIGMLAALKAAEPATVTVVMDAKVLTIGKPPMLPGVDFAKVIDGTTGLSLTLKVGSEVTLRGVAVCKDGQAAADVKKQAEALRDYAVKAMQAGPPNVVPKEVVELPGKIAIAAKGSLCEATLTVKDDAVIGLIKAWIVPSGSKPDNVKPTETKPIEKKPPVDPKSPSEKPPVEKKP